MNLSKILGKYGGRAEEPGLYTYTPVSGKKGKGIGPWLAAGAVGFGTILAANLPDGYISFGGKGNPEGQKIVQVQNKQAQKNDLNKLLGVAQARAEGGPSVYFNFEYPDPPDKEIIGFMRNLKVELNKRGITVNDSESAADVTIYGGCQKVWGTNGHLYIQFNASYIIAGTPVPKTSVEEVFEPFDSMNKSVMAADKIYSNVVTLEFLTHHKRNKGNTGCELPRLPNGQVDESKAARIFLLPKAKEGLSSPYPEVREQWSNTLGGGKIVRDENGDYYHIFRH